MKIALIVNKEKARAVQTAENVVHELAPHGAELCTCEDCPVTGTTVMTTAEALIRACDIAVTVGGDGTIIHHAKYAAVYQKPLLGINLGRVGFVANIEPDCLKELKKLRKLMREKDINTEKLDSMIRENKSSLFVYHILRLNILINSLNAAVKIRNGYKYVLD